MTKPGPKPRPLVARLAERSVRDESGCVLFTGHLDAQGYGRMYVGAAGEKILVHRISHELYIGPVPPGYQVDHLCGVRHCVNPAHLEAVTAVENTRRASAGNARKTHCDSGHEFTPENTRIIKRPNGTSQRVCRLCDARRARETRLRRATA